MEEKRRGELMSERGKKNIINGWKWREEDRELMDEDKRSGELNNERGEKRKGELINGRGEKR